MCVCCPPICWAACFVAGAARKIGQPRSPEEIARQRGKREKKGLGEGVRWGVKTGLEGGLPTIGAHRPGALAAHATSSGAAVTTMPSFIEMPERRQRGQEEEKEEESWEVESNRV